MQIKSITAETTDEQILAATVAIRAEIAQMATVGNGAARDFAGLANQLAEAEGRANAYAVIRDCLANDVEPVGIEKALTHQLLNGADDTWSGRTNDVRRAWFDGFKSAAAAYLRGF